MLLTSTQVAQTLDVSIGVIHRMVREGHLSVANPRFPGEKRREYAFRMEDVQAAKAARDREAAERARTEALRAERRAARLARQARQPNTPPPVNGSAVTLINPARLTALEEQVGAIARKLDALLKALGEVGA